MKDSTKVIILILIILAFLGMLSNCSSGDDDCPICGGSGYYQKKDCPGC